MRRHLVHLLAVLVLVAGCSGPAGEKTAAPAATPPTTPPAAAEPAAATTAPGERSIGPNTRPIMLEVLARERDAGRQAWLSIGSGDPESAALKDQIASLFQDAGWTVHTQTLTGLRLKPGLVLLMAEETPPAYTQTVVEAFDASGLEVKSASGYRAYYEEMKQQNPDWPGIPMTKEQDFTLVIGPRPTE
jgi:hypothetical protein